MSKTETQFLGEELAPHENEAETALFHVLPCGLEKTVSYGSGTARGPAAIIAASHQLERFIAGGEPCAAGIFTHAPIECDQTSEAVMAQLRTQSRIISQSGKIPITLGGEHSLSYGAVMGVADALEADIGIIHIDAHADFRVAYQGHKHSHASVMHLLAQEGFAMCSFGVRALSRAEDAARRAHGVIFYDAAELVRDTISCIELPADFPHNLYISFDLDGLDPSILPATGTPVPGGLGFYQALDLVASTLRGRQCVGMDIVELAPQAAHRASDFTAAMITYHLMALALKRN